MFNIFSGYPKGPTMGARNPEVMRPLTRIHAFLRQTRLGAIARKLGIGRFLLWLTWGGYHRRILFSIGPFGYLRFLYARHIHLPAIAKAPPLSGRDRSFEVHMLLNHGRILEGAWALYSFQHLSEASAHIVIHDDGTLQDKDLTLLRSLFSPITIWRRAAADDVCVSRLKQLGFERLVRFRSQLVFALKLTDPVLLGRTRSIVIMDSDVLFFKTPTEILNAALSGEAAYSLNCGDYYCVPESDLSDLIGGPLIPRCNAGLLVVDRRLVDLERWNDYLREPRFWNSDGTGEYHAEETLWACELARLKATPLPASYAIGAPKPSKFHFGHYHGGGPYHSTLFYTRGLPYVRKLIPV